MDGKPKDFRSELTFHDLEKPLPPLSENYRDLFSKKCYLQKNGQYYFSKKINIDKPNALSGMEEVNK